MRWRHKKKALKKRIEGRPLTRREREYVESVPNVDILGLIDSFTEAIVDVCERLAEGVVEGVGLAKNALVGILGACNERLAKESAKEVLTICPDTYQEQFGGVEEA